MNTPGRATLAAVTVAVLMVLGVAVLAIIMALATRLDSTAGAIVVLIAFAAVVAIVVAIGRVWSTWLDRSFPPELDASRPIGDDDGPNQGTEPWGDGWSR